MTGLLERIVTNKRIEIAELHKKTIAASMRTTLDVRAALRNPSALALIGEVKFKSPSAGELSRALSPGDRAVAYARGGARMVSVLCDQPFFGGSYDDVATARAALDAENLPIPILAKEFILDDVQLARAREVGADAALIIARILPGDALGELVRACVARSLEPFVEVAGDDELDRALVAGAHVIGVNVRDLDTLVMDTERAARLLARIPKDRIAVHLSGIRGVEQITAAAKTRADAALIGESLMRADDPSNILKRFSDAAKR